MMTRRAFDVSPGELKPGDRLVIKADLSGRIVSVSASSDAYSYRILVQNYLWPFEVDRDKTVQVVRVVDI